MSEAWPVYVASRGRAECLCIEQLQADGIAVTLVVEPHEADAYGRHAGPSVRVHVLPDDDRGLCYARDQTLELARADGAEWCWIIDDDVTGFYRRDTARRRMVKCGAAEALLAAQVVLMQDQMVALGGLEYRQFAWSTKRVAAVNSYTDVVMAANVPLLQRYRIAYDLNFRLKGDRDLMLQVLHKGLRTVRVQTHAFAAPKNGSNKGGLHDKYAVDGFEFEQSKKLVAKWPAVCSLQHKKDGRPDVRVAWRTFAPARHC